MAFRTGTCLNNSCAHTEETRLFSTLMRNEMRGSMMLGDCIPECPDEPPPCPLPCPINVKVNVDQMTMRLNPASDRPDTLILPADGAITVPPDGAAIQHLFVSLSAKN